MAGRVLGASPLGPQPQSDIYRRRLGSLLNPAKIAQFQNNCDVGYPSDWHDLMNEVRQKAPDLHSVLQTRELGLLSRGWHVHPWKEPGAREASAADIEIANFVRDRLGKIRAFDRSLAHLIDANYKGYSVCETEWAKVDGKLVPVALHNVAGRRWAITPDQRLVLYDGGAYVGDSSDSYGMGRDVIGQYPARFVVHAPRINGDSLSREGLGRCLIWFAAFSNWAWRDWILFAELFGKPGRRIEYDPEHYQTDTDTRVKEALDNYIASGYGIFPNGSKLITDWPDGGRSDTTPSPSIIEKAADWMALATLGQRQTVADVSGGMGANGDVRDLVRRDILKADDVALGKDTITGQLIHWMVRLNFGENAPLPCFGWDVEEPKDLKSFSEGIAKLAPMMRIPTRYVHESTGIPEPVDGEEVLTSPTPQAPPGATNDAPDGNADDNPGESADKPKDETK